MQLWGTPTMGTSVTFCVTVCLPCALWEAQCPWGHPQMALLMLVTDP